MFWVSAEVGMAGELRLGLRFYESVSFKESNNGGKGRGASQGRLAFSGVSRSPKKSSRPSVKKDDGIIGGIGW